MELLPNKNDGLFMELVMANVGRGTAFNVGFKINADKEDFQRCDVIPLRGTSADLHFLLPGTSLAFGFGAFHDLVQRREIEGKVVTDPFRPFLVTVLYEDCDGKCYCRTSSIDIRTYDGLTRSTASVARKHQKHIEEISKTLRQIL